jgi:hypothetical protein
LNEQSDRGTDSNIDSTLPIHYGKYIGEPSSDSLQKALVHLKKQYGSFEAVGSPRVGGIRETLYIRTNKTSLLFDISHPDRPRELQKYEYPPWYEGMAMGRKLIAIHKAKTDSIELFAAKAIRNL